MSAFRLLAIGGSYGSIEALSTLLPPLSAITDIPIVVILHRQASGSDNFLSLWDKQCRATVIEAAEREAVSENTIYFAPAGYHLYLDETYTFSLSMDEPENYSRPSVDVFFECAAEVYGDELIAILLTGANSDGAKGIA